MSNLKRIREASGLSQGKLAEASGISVRMIQYYEQGVKDINKAQADTIYKLSKALKCTMEDVIDIKDALGRYKWHDLRQNPDDLPDHAVLGVDDADGYYVCFYRAKVKQWVTQFTDYYPNIIAWREIDLFEEA